MKEQLNFEAALKELEEINNQFAEGKIGLEKGLSKFKRALELANYLKKRLDEVENQIKEIKAEFPKEKPSKEIEEPE